MVFDSVLELELRAGMSNTSASRGFCYDRHIDGIETHLTHKLAPRFIDVIEYNYQRMLDLPKQHRLSMIKLNLRHITSALPGAKIRNYKAQLWENVENDFIHDYKLQVRKNETERIFAVLQWGVGKMHGSL